jgi:hypothetical protein
MKQQRRKLLVASVGVAAVSYVVGVACGETTSGNLVAPPAEDARVDQGVTSGNLPAPPPVDAASDQGVTSGNLPAPPPFDAGDAGDGGDAEAGS